MADEHDFLQGTLVYGLGSALVRAIAIISNILLATLLTTEIYGEISILWVSFSIISSVSVLGIPEGLARNIAHADESGEERAYIPAAYLMLIPGNVVVMLVAVLGTEHLIRIFSLTLAPIYVIAFALLFPLNAVTQISNAILRAHSHPGLKSFADLLARFFSLVAFITLVYLATLPTAGTSYYLVFLVTNAILSTVFASQYVVSSSKSYIVNTAQRLVSFSWPLTFQGTFISILMFLDIIAVGYFIGNTASGVYRAAWVLAQVPLFSIQILQFLYTPMQARQYAEQQEEMSLTYKSSTKWIVLLSFPVVFLLVTESRAILMTVYNAEYTTGWLVLILLTFSSFIRILSGPDDLTITAIGRTKILLFSSLGAALANIVLNVLLVPRFGIVGGAIATLFSFLLLHGSQLLYLQLEHGLHPFSRRLLLVGTTVVPLAWGLIYILPTRPTTLPALMVFTGVLTFLTVIVAITLGATADERRLLKRTLSEVLG